MHSVLSIARAGYSSLTLYSRLTLRRLVEDTEEHDLDARRKEITLRTSKTQIRINNWRKIQTELMPRVGDMVSAQAMAAPAVQNEKLFLPSDFASEAERQALDLVNLAVEEARWREGQAFDSLRAIQNIVKAITALRNRKIKNDRQQKQNSRAGDQIADTIKRRDRHMDSYEVARQRLIVLNAGPAFPRLTEPDLYMKSVQQKRRVGDSRHTDGALWRVEAQIAVTGDIEMEDARTIPVKTGQNFPHISHPALKSL